jgi:hypothetical protein
VRFALPPMHEGLDGARVVLVLPAAPTEPRAAEGGDTAEDAVTLRRSADHDELELVRPHIPKNDAAVFVARVDPKALGALDVPAPSVAPLASHPDITSHPSPGIAILAAACALLVLGVGSAKERLLRGSVAAVVPLWAPGRHVSAALLVAFGVFLQARERYALGAALVALAMPLLAWRARKEETRLRSPETWLVTRPEDVLVDGSAADGTSQTRTDVLDATTRSGQLAVAGVVLAVAVACLACRGYGPAASWMTAIDALVLVPVFFTGTSHQRRPSVSRQAAVLAHVARALAQRDELKVAPLVRMLADGTADEARILVSPRLGMAGVAAIEVGVAWERAGGAMLPWLDVLVRVHDGTFASAKIASAFPHKRPLPGRKPEERVIRFAPAWPTLTSVVERVVELAEVVRDRRLTLGARPEDAERRLPPKRAAINTPFVA